MTNRNRSPKIISSHRIHWITPNKRALNNHSNLYWIVNTNSDTCKVEFNFHIDNKEDNQLIKYLSYNMLLSGNESLTSGKIKEEFDHLGAYTDIQVFDEYAEISIYVLKENLIQSIELLFTCLNYLSYPKKEFDVVLKNKKSNFLINENKSSAVARKEFKKRLFRNSILGTSIQKRDFELIKSNDLNNYFNKSIRANLNKIGIVGNITEQEIDAVQRIVDSWILNSPHHYFSCEKSEIGEFHIPLDSGIQTTIRAGKFCMSKSDKDFFSFSILQTILGDYFGSRLMKNIREDKGYTYGIGSMIQHLKNNSYFFIHTQVAKEYKEKTIHEIEKEFHKLREEKVSFEELTIVKNYLMGQALKSADGAFAQMNLFMGVEKHNLDMKFYEGYLNAIIKITPEQIQEQAKKHLDWNNYTIVCAG